MLIGNKQKYITGMYLDAAKCNTYELQLMGSFHSEYFSAL